EHKVASLFTAPTAFRAIKKEDPKGALIADYDVSSLRSLFLAGERTDPATLVWAEEKLKVPVIDHWWQTETGWAISGNPIGLGMFDVRHGSPGKPMPGYDMQVLDDAGKPVEPGVLGNIVVKLPLPPGCTPVLWRAEDRFRKSYLDDFPGFYATSDAGIIDADGYLHIMARTDDIINVAGHRLSTGAMEEVLAHHPDVAECAVVGKAERHLPFQRVSFAHHGAFGDI
ncbi:MAG: AMP-binding protein, partial [Pseudomonadota bacterium]